MNGIQLDTVTLYSEIKTSDFLEMCQEKNPLWKKSHISVSIETRIQKYHKIHI